MCIYVYVVQSYSPIQNGSSNRASRDEATLIVEGFGRQALRMWPCQANSMGMVTISRV